MNWLDINNLNAYIAALAVLGISVSGVLQSLKKFLTREKKMVHVMYLALTFVAAALVQWHDKLPLKVGAISLVSVYGVAALVYNWSKLINGLLASVYGGNGSVIPPVAQIDSKTTEVMTGVKTVAKDAEAAEHVFAG